MTATVDPIGGIMLDTLRFTTDPEHYTPPRSVTPKRSTSTPGIQGTYLFQHVAGHAADAPIVLQGSGGQGLTQECRDALDVLAAGLGEVYTFTDWLGNAVDVVIDDWDGGTLNLPWMLYDYRLVLRKRGVQPPDIVIPESEDPGSPGDRLVTSA